MPRKLSEETKINIEKLAIPEGFILVKDPEIEILEKKQVEIEELETKLNEMEEPKEEELIMYAKQWHPYYELKNKLWQ